jgi:transcriptional regulator with XRE-family HTH domain
MITGAQIRAARRLLGWSQFELSRQSGVSEATIHRFEKGRIEPRVDTRAAIAKPLLEGGVEFVDSVGVHLRADKQVVT